MIQAEKLLFAKITERIGKRPNFLGFDLGNEINILPKFAEPTTMAEGDAWHREMIAFCDEIAPGKLHVNGVDHEPWFGDSGFSRGGIG